MNIAKWQVLIAKYWMINPNYGTTLRHANCRMLNANWVKHGYIAFLVANISILYKLNAVFKIVASLLVNENC